MIIKKLKLLRSILGAFKQFFDAPQRASSGISKLKNSPKNTPENSPKKKKGRMSSSPPHVHVCVADNYLIMRWKSMYLVVISVPDICSFR